ncbi:MAG: type IV toxin-antitoxin system AbiEi family antitoxin domain-containing protein [Fibrobacteria bacterium]
MSNRLSEAALRKAGIGAFFKPKDLRPLGISYRQIQEMVADGTVERIGTGLYRLQAMEPDEHETLAMVATAVPKAILCLLTALSIHGIGTQVPHEVWIALDRKARKPERLPAKVKIVRYSGAMLTYGIEQQTLLGRPIRITSPARTVVDCFRYRNKFGTDIAIEALRDVLRSKKTTVVEITRAAEACRIRTVVGRYLEAL